MDFDFDILHQMRGCALLHALALYIYVLLKIPIDHFTHGILIKVVELMGPVECLGTLGFKIYSLLAT